MATLTGYEIQMYQDIHNIANSLESIANNLALLTNKLLKEKSE